MMVEMKVTHPTLMTHLRRHEQGWEQSLESNPGVNLKRSNSGHER